MNLKEKTINGIKWSIVESYSNNIVLFIFSIVLARLLKPEDFGIIGIIGIFISFSTVFIYSGMGEALLRMKSIKQDDLSTVFIFNLTVSLIFYLLLFFFSASISGFFNEPVIEGIIKFFCLVLIIDAFGFVPRIILTKNIDFKSQAKVSVISSIVSGSVGVYLAFEGFGVWSLVFRTLFQSILKTSLLWIYSKYAIIFSFSKDVLREIFGFSSKIMLSALIHQVYLNVNQLIIGKFYSSAQLGYYSKANQFQSLAGSQLDIAVQRVTYPVLSEMQDDIERMKKVYKKLIIGTMFLSFPILIWMSAASEQLILTLIGERWAQSIVYLRLICFAGMLYPLHSLNLNILKVKGRSDLFLKLEIIKKGLAIPVIIAGIFIGIRAMIAVMIINSFIAWFINGYYSGRLINYPVKEQIADILPSFIFSAFMGITVFLIGHSVEFKPVYELLVQSVTGFSIMIFFLYVFNREIFSEFKQIFETILKR